MGPGDHHTNGLSIAIQIRWKFRFTFTSILTKWLIKICVYDTTAKFVVIRWSAMVSLRKVTFPSTFNCQQIIISETGLVVRQYIIRLCCVIYDIVTETNILAQTVYIALQRLAFLQLVCLVLRISWLQYFPRFWHQNTEAWAKWSMSYRRLFQMDFI